jgi:hypothetical protein
MPILVEGVQAVTGLSGITNKTPQFFHKCNLSHVSSMTILCTHIQLGGLFLVYIFYVFSICNKSMLSMKI